MRRMIPIAALLIAAPVVAQDMPGAVDLGALSRSQVQRGAMDGHAERDGRGGRGPNGVALSAKSRAYCESFPAYRSRFGAGDTRVVKLAAACRQAGYPY